jgi:outer membrane protein OmpA-like peptidoglycan-associated protein
VIVAGAASATGGFGVDTVSRPFFGGGPAPLRSHDARAQASGADAIPDLGAGTGQAPAEPGKLPRALAWVVAALLLFSLLAWGFFRLAPKPTAPQPATPHVGAAEQGGHEHLPGKVSVVAPSLGAAREQGVSSQRAPQQSAPERAAKSSNAAVQGRANTNAESAAEARADRSASRARRQASRAPAATTESAPRLAGDEAVRALRGAATPQTGAEPLDDALLPTARPEADPALPRLGEFDVQPTSSVSEAGSGPRPNVALPPTASGSALPRYFEGGALPPKRFVLQGLSFAPSSAALPAHQPVLDRAADALRDHQSSTVLIEGFGDASGDPGRRDAHAVARAASVNRYLQARGGDARQLRIAHSERGVGRRRVDLVVLTR